MQQLTLTPDELAPAPSLRGHQRRRLTDAEVMAELRNAHQTLVKAELEADGVHPAIHPDNMPSGGWTETYLTEQAPWLTLTPFVEQVLAALGDDSCHG